MDEDFEKNINNIICCAFAKTLPEEKGQKLLDLIKVLIIYQYILDDEPISYKESIDIKEKYDKASDYANELYLELSKIYKNVISYKEFISILMDEVASFKEKLDKE